MSRPGKAVARVYQNEKLAWQIEWVGPHGAFKSGIWYRTQIDARAMAQFCGAKPDQGEVVVDQ